MTLPAADPFNPFSALLIHGLENVLDFLMKAGYQKAQAMFNKLTHADQRALQKALEKAYKAAGDGKFDQRFKSLLENADFQKKIVTGLLDPIEGFNLPAVQAAWLQNIPDCERDLRAFFRRLEKLLLKDPLWKPLLEVSREAIDDQAPEACGMKVGEIVAGLVIGGDTFQNIEAGGNWDWA